MLSNAVKYSTDGVTIRMRVRNADDLEDGNDDDDDIYADEDLYGDDNVIKNQNFNLNPRPTSSSKNGTSLNQLHGTSFPSRSFSTPVNDAEPTAPGVENSITMLQPDILNELDAFQRGSFMLSCQDENHRLPYNDSEATPTLFNSSLDGNLGSHAKEAMETASAVAPSLAPASPSGAPVVSFSNGRPNMA